jgi:EAL domain-containing protein (putative c-di-GMP-specific phosphodiesterase class I)
LLNFHEAGIQIAIDDFGTGYSSLAYLKKFDIDYVKIDQSFTRNIQVGSDDLALCETIIVMAHKLGIKVIAEGVEPGEQCDLLLATGYVYAEGYLFSGQYRRMNLKSYCVNGKTSSASSIKALPNFMLW